MEMKIVYALNKEDLKNSILETLTEISEKQFLSKFDGIFVGSNAACEILNISRTTLHRYINAGLLKPEEKGYKEAIRFRLSYLLAIDMKELRWKLRHGV